MDTEALKWTLEKEWFPIVYERRDEPETVYPKHFHEDKVSFFVTAGEVEFTFDDGTKKKVSSGERFNVPVKVYHTALVGPDGCEYVVGQMSEDDA